MMIRIFEFRLKESLLVSLLGIFVLPNSRVESQWIQELPIEIQQSILWSADHEEGDLSDWTFPLSKYPGGGVFNSPEKDVIATATRNQAHSGKFSAMASIEKAVRSQNGVRAVRLMRWTDRPFDNGGNEFNNEAYYSTWMFIPDAYNPNKYAPWDPGDGGWWNVFQFKAHDDEDVSQPVCSLCVGHNDQSKQLAFYLYSAINSPSSFAQPLSIPVPINRWLHIEARYKPSFEKEGSITIWQDGVQILDVKNIKTIVSKKHAYVVWGIGNYTDHIALGSIEGKATVYFDDAVVSIKPLSTFVSAMGRSE